ncbi:MAG TPA: PIN domain-containing protein [Acidimicrobiales bacterium]|nr:PIN domain-containing protein [Acidimicrobiales bacterium]
MPGAGRRVLAIDTSVAVALLLRRHEAHSVVTTWRDGRKVALCGHAWIETYAVLTRLPGTARINPADALRLLNSNFSAPISPRPETLRGALETLAGAGIAGGATYDGWVALAARDNDAILVSRDARAEATYRRIGVEVEMVI